MRRTAHSEPDVWSRRRLLVVLTAAGLTVVLLLAGLGVAIHGMLTTTDSAASTMSSGSASLDPREELADRAFPVVEDSAARPGTLSTTPFETLAIPSPTRAGVAGVATGFPQTPAGALAQLIALDQSALQSGTVAGAQEVVRAWAVPEGPNPATWSGVRAVADLLQAAGLSAEGSPTLVVSASPEMGLVKGSVGPAYVVACVDFVVTATLSQTARVAVSDCQRMEWRDDRWMIGAGPEPAQAPSVWPGTDAAHLVGFQELRYE